MSSMNLPLELVEHIVRCVEEDFDAEPRDTWSSLCALARVSRTWHAVANERLYRAPYIADFGGRIAVHDDSPSPSAYTSRGGSPGEGGYSSGYEDPNTFHGGPTDRGPADRDHHRTVTCTDESAADSLFSPPYPSPTSLPLSHGLIYRPPPGLARAYTFTRTLGARPDLAALVEILPLGTWTANLHHDVGVGIDDVSRWALDVLRLCPNITHLDFPGVSLVDAPNVEHVLSQRTRITHVVYGNHAPSGDPGLLAFDAAIYSRLATAAWSALTMARIVARWPQFECLELADVLDFEELDAFAWRACALEHVVFDFGGRGRGRGGRGASGRGAAGVSSGINTVSKDATQYAESTTSRPTLPHDTQFYPAGVMDMDVAPPLPSALSTGLGLVSSDVPALSQTRLTAQARVTGSGSYADPADDTLSAAFGGVSFPATLPSRGPPRHVAAHNLLMLLSGSRKSLRRMTVREKHISTTGIDNLLREFGANLREFTTLADRPQGGSGGGGRSTSRSSGGSPGRGRKASASSSPNYAPPPQPLAYRPQNAGLSLGDDAAASTITLAQLVKHTRFLECVTFYSALLMSRINLARIAALSSLRRVHIACAVFSWDISLGEFLDGLYVPHSTVELKDVAELLYSDQLPHLEEVIIEAADCPWDADDVKMLKESLWARRGLHFEVVGAE